MPRGKKRTTMTGEDAQTIQSVPGQRYGESKEQQELLQAMPAPDRTSSPAMHRPAAEEVPMPEAGPDPSQISAFLGSHRPSLLSGTQRPETPVTDGLTTGPGRGPEALHQAQIRTPMARYLRNLSDETGNAKWRRLAERAGMA